VLRYTRDVGFRVRDWKGQDGGKRVQEKNDIAMKQHSEVCSTLVLSDLGVLCYCIRRTRDIYVYC
jgi:hypothetical protein